MTHEERDLLAVASVAGVEFSAAFIYGFCQNVLLARVPIGRRVGLHLRIGERLERAHAALATEIAGELAAHFEHGRDLERAVKYRRLAASTGAAGLAIAAHHGAGIVTFYRGDFAASLAHFAHVLGGYDPARHRPHACLPVERAV